MAKTKTTEPCHLKTAIKKDKPEGTTRYYYVDEAGDGVLFSARGRIRIGFEGCSNHFMLGLADIPDEAALNTELADLRKNLLSDPYFKNVPSLLPVSGKTAAQFHAKDDLPEVRREVFSILLKHDIGFYAAIKDKRKVLEYVQQRNTVAADYRYHPNELYDHLVKRLFKDRLHKHDEYHIVFARRGSADRTQAFCNSLEDARKRFTDKWGIASKAPYTVVCGTMKDYGGLQAVDYFLWALQRLYERREERYLQYIWPKVHLIQDIDDTRLAPYGVFYIQKKPPTLATIKNVQGI